MTITKWKHRSGERIVASVIAALNLHQFNKWKVSPPQKAYRARERERRTVLQIYQMLGPYYFQRAYRMSYNKFQTLSHKLSQYMKKRNIQKVAWNGPIYNSIRVACAIRYFAGGSPYDIATTFGISLSEVFVSVWDVVDAVNQHPNFKINYPDSTNKQNEIALGFKDKSGAGFNCCAGAIDGILIWMHKPRWKCCEEASCDAGKFFCGRKHKFGLNCQAVCDSRGRFLDISILFPASTADCLAFEGMTLHRRLKDGLLAPGLCLFGDNAYLNTPFMATPFSGGAATGAKDAYNFYHSQLRIQIECAFGKLTQRWGILRSAIPKGISIKKTVALVLSLAKLHNFLIEDENEGSMEASLAQDERHMEQIGAVPLEDNQETNGQGVPVQLLGGGSHFEGMDRNERRRLHRSFSGIELPREHLYAEVLDKDLQRPLRNI